MSIKLDKEKNESSNIKTLIKQALLDPTYETEVIMGGNMYLGSNITYNQFKKLFNRIRGKSQYKENASTHKLIITFSSDSKFKDIRIIISGFTAINSYCINEKLEPILSSVIFQRKQLVNEKIRKVNCTNYNFKINQKKEETLDIDSTIVRECMKSWSDLDKIFRYKKSYSFTNIKPNQSGLYTIDCAVVRNSSFDDVIMTKKQVMSKDLFFNVVKPRTDKRKFADWWKSIKPEDNVQVRHVQSYHKTLKASKCFEADLDYELEIELHQDKVLNHFKTILGLKESDNVKQYETVKKLMMDLNNIQRDKIIDFLFASLFENVGLCLQCCQSSFYLMSNNESYSTIKDFKKLVNQRGNNDNIFFGPLPVDLNLDNVVEYHPDIIKSGAVPTICYDYAVSEKIDGERCLVYIDDKGEVFCIDRNGSVFIRRMGLHMPPEIANTVLDGEYVEYDKAGNYINKFYGFDCYFFKGKNLMNMVFSTNQGKTDSERLFYLNKVVRAFNDGTNVRSFNKNIKTTSINFKLDRVSFYFGESSLTAPERQRPELIFNYCKELLNKMNVKYGGLLEEGHLYSYPTDGLIFTPCLKPVYENYNLSYISEHNSKAKSNKSSKSSKSSSAASTSTSTSISTSDNEISNDSISEQLTSAQEKLGNTASSDKDIIKTVQNKTNYGRKWDSFFKWKSNNYLTMDLKVRVTKQEKSKQRIVHYEGNKSYAVCNLLCSNYAGDFINSSKNNMSAVCVNHNRNLGKEGHELPIYSINPSVGTKSAVGNGIMFIDSLNECHLEISTLNNDEIRCENGDIIFDGNVVEFKYDSSITNPMFRWKPLRVRQGKKANALNTCLDIWQLINKALDTNTICDYDSTQEFVKNNTNNLLQLNTYSKIEKINNVYQQIMENINKIMVLNNCDKLSNPSAMVMGCGNLSNFTTYIEAGISKLVGLDNNSRLLNDKYIGAGALLSNSYNDLVKKFRYNTLLLNVDVSNDLMDPMLNESGKVDGRNSYYLDILYGREKPSDMDSKKLMRFDSLGVEGFHIVVAKENFLNTMFSDHERLSTFIDNVSKNLQDQGLFISSYIDGFKVCNVLSESNKSVHTVKDSEETTIYEIRGLKGINYELSDTKILPVGLEYERYVQGLSGYQSEYCVDFKLFEKLCLDKGLRVIENKSLVEEPGSYFTESILLGDVKVKDSSSNIFKDYFTMCNTVILQKDNSLLSVE